MKNWKTTLAGLAAGAATAGTAILDAAQQGAFTGKTGFALLAAVGMFLFGIFAKDNNVTGGTVAQTGEATKRVG